jgi:TonB family protein
MISPSVPVSYLQKMIARYPASTTTFQVQVDAAGHPHNLTVLHHSQDSALDKRVTDEVLASTFEPARHGCAAVAGTFTSSVTRLPAPTALIIARPGPEAAAPKRVAGCATPHRDALAKNVAKPDLTAPMKDLIASTRRTFLNTVTVHVTRSGSVGNAVLNKSSGSKVFDDAAISAAGRTTYAPRIVNCMAVPSTQIIMTAFTGWLEP